MQHTIFLKVEISIVVSVICVIVITSLLYYIITVLHHYCITENIGRIKHWWIVGKNQQSFLQCPFAIVRPFANLFSSK